MCPLAAAMRARDLDLQAHLCDWEPTTENREWLLAHAAQDVSLVNNMHRTPYRRCRLELGEPGWSCTWSNFGEGPKLASVPCANSSGSSLGAHLGLPKFFSKRRSRATAAINPSQLPARAAPALPGLCWLDLDASLTRVRAPHWWYHAGNGHLSASMRTGGVVGVRATQDGHLVPRKD